MLYPATSPSSKPTENTIFGLFFALLISVSESLKMFSCRFKILFSNLVSGNPSIFKTSKKHSPPLFHYSAKWPYSGTTLYDYQPDCLILSSLFQINNKPYNLNN